MKISSLQCNSKSLKSLWNLRAENLYGFANAPSTGYYRRREIHLIKKHFGSLKNKKVLKLDLWNESNNTKILSWVAQQKAKVYGIDISKILVRRAQRNFKRSGLQGKFYTCDMRKIVFADNFFDFIYTMGTIEHVPDYERVIHEIYRVLKPGGKAIVGVPNSHDPFCRPFIVSFLEMLNIYPYSPEKAFSFQELSMLLKGAGFKICSRDGLLFMPGILRIFDMFFYKYYRLFNKLTGILIKPFEYLENLSSFFSKHGYLIVSVIRKPNKKR